MTNCVKHREREKEREREPKTINTVCQMQPSDERMKKKKKLKLMFFKCRVESIVSGGDWGSIHHLRVKSVKILSFLFYCTAIDGVAATTQSANRRRLSRRLDRFIFPHGVF